MDFKTYLSSTSSTADVNDINESAMPTLSNDLAMKTAIWDVSLLRSVNSIKAYFYYISDSVLMVTKVSTSKDKRTLYVTIKPDGRYDQEQLGQDTAQFSTECQKTFGVPARGMIKSSTGGSYIFSLTFD